MDVPKRFKEPSTYAGIASALAAIAPFFAHQPIVAALASFFGAVAVALTEKSHAPPAP